MTQDLTLVVGLDQQPTEAHAENDPSTIIVTDLESALDFLWIKGSAVREIWLADSVAEAPGTADVIALLGRDWPAIAIRKSSGAPSVIRNPRLYGQKS